MGQKSRWTLPDTVEPATERCFVVHVPNDKFYLAAFRGALFEMAKAYSWENDDSHTAKDVAARCLQMWEDVQEVGCDLGDVQFRQSGTSCQWQISIDGGAHWFDMPDMTQCATDIAGGAIQDAINDGTLAQRGQQPPGGTPGIRECRTYHVTLQGNGIWHCPIAVRGGSTVHITGANGGWWDGGEVRWRCPDGSAYALGECLDPSSKVTDPADPLNTSAHMSIVGHYNAVYFDTQTLYTVPSSVTATELFLQANDSGLSNNQGSVQFDVEVCSGDWCFLFDFTQNNGGWTPYAGNQAVYVPGLYWDGVNIVLSVQRHICQIRVDFAASNITYVKMTYNRTPSGTQNAGVAGAAIEWNGVGKSIAMPSAGSGTGLVIDFASDKPGTVTITADVQSSHGSYGGVAQITSIEVHGYGTCPFGTPNC